MSYVPVGIKNIGSSCYAASITQCLYRLFHGSRDENILHNAIEYMYENLSGHSEDSNELYVLLLDKYPQLRSKLEIKYANGVSLPYIPISPSMSNIGDHIIQCNIYVCLYRYPDLQAPNTWLDLEIDCPTTKRYRLCACICHPSGHYYALINTNNTWYKCDDENITIANPLEQHPIYMLFYILK